MVNQREGEMQQQQQEEEQKKRHKTFHHHPYGRGRDHCVHLPIDIIRSILSRLSARTLGRLRCVCKQWRSLTHDARFALEQHARGALAGPPSIFQAHPSYLGYHLDFFAVHVHDFCERGLLTAHRIYECSTGNCYPPSSNFLHGLTCTMDTNGKDTYLYLLNPTTREIVKLPTSGCPPCLPKSYGFGYDATARDYKVIVIYLPHGKHNYMCEVLTLGSRSTWRHLGIVPYNFMCVGVSNIVVPPVFLHGAIHWAGYCDYVSNSRQHVVAVLTFDVRDEKFGKISSPLILDEETHHGLCAIELRGHIALVFWEGQHYDRDILNIWCLKKYAGHEWTLGWRIDFSRCTFDLPRTIVAVCHVDKESLHLLDDVGVVFSYDIRSKNLSKIYKLLLTPCYRSTVYQESLLSPEIVGNPNV